MILKQLIEEELLPRIYVCCYPIKKQTIKGIFYGNNEFKRTGDRYARNSFEGILNLKCCQEDINNVDGEYICEELKHLCKKYTSSKKTIVNVSCELAYMLERRLNITIDLKEPNLNYENAIERQLFLIKFLHHDERHTFSDACKYLWMYNDEKLVDDIGAIKKGLSFLGKGIKLEIDKNNNEITSFPTGHPIILVENMSQIFVQLEGLRKMANGPTKASAMRTAATIWNQLSDYAKQRVFYVVENLYDSDIEFYHQLNEMDKNEIFYDEDSLSNIKGPSSILNYLKNSYDFYIMFNDEESRSVIKHVKYGETSKSIIGESYYLIDLDSNQEFTVKEADIIGCAREKRELYNLI